MSTENPYQLYLRDLVTELKECYQEAQEKSNQKHFKDDIDKMIKQGICDGYVAIIKKLKSKVKEVSISPKEIGL